MSDSKWYILHTVSGSEKKMKTMIMEQANKESLSHFIEEIVIPTQAVVEVRRGKKVAVDKKFLPGYILLKLSDNDKVWQLIRSVPRAGKFLGGDGRPLPISQSEVDSIFKHIEEGVNVSSTSVNFEVGESVKIIDGPFDSFTGNVVEIDLEKSRLKLNVSIFGRPTPVELEFTQVEKL